VDDPFNFSTGFHTTFHYPGGTEGYTNYDKLYSSPPFWINPVITKIVSIIPGYELRVDTRPLESFTPIDLELSLHSEHDTPINVSNLENWLRCVIDPNNQEYFFNPKPLTLWRRFPAEPNNLQFLAELGEACAKSNSYNENGAKIATIPLPNLNGTYESQVPYDFLQVRFDVYPGDFNLDGKVNMKDLPYIGNDWGKKGQPLDFIGDITGPQGLPDGTVDGFDLERKIRDWLKNIRDIMPAE
jgi:hypothetical protein